jgi:hypothetical protein
MNNWNQQLLNRLKEDLVDQRGTIRELTNRIQAKDLHAFASLQASTQPAYREDDVQYPRTDAAEARKIMEAYGSMEGFGDLIIPDEQEQEILEMIGANFSDNA